MSHHAATRPIARAITKARSGGCLQIDSCELPNVSFNHPLLGICRARLPCLRWGDLRAEFKVSLAEPDCGGFGALRIEGFLAHLVAGGDHFVEASGGGGLDAEVASARIPLDGVLRRAYAQIIRVLSVIEHLLLVVDENRR